MIPEIMFQLINPPSDNVAVYLSGGIDSAITLYHVVQKCRNVRTYTASFGVAADECTKAREVAEWFGTTHTEVPITDFLETLPEILKHFDRPRYNVWPWWLAQQAHTDGITTAYIGEGSDEIFGYPDRGYLEGWAGQLVYVRPTWDICNQVHNIDLKAPFTELHHYMIEPPCKMNTVLEFYKPPMKEWLRKAYHRRIPEWILVTPTRPPAMCSYVEFGKKLGLTGDIKQQLQLIATRIWLEVHS